MIAFKTPGGFFNTACVYSTCQFLKCDVMRCSVVLTIFNEEGNIKPFTEDILRMFDDEGIEGEVILVDDGSFDGSELECKDMVKRDDRVRFFQHQKNMGRAWAIATGIEHSRGGVVLVMDSDRQYDAGEMPTFIKLVEGGFDMVSGRRPARQDRADRRFISWGYNRFMVRGFLRMGIIDQNSGFKAYSRKALNVIKFDPEGYNCLHRYMIAIGLLKGLSFKEIPVKHFPRTTGSSYINPITGPLYTLLDFLRFVKTHRKDINAFKGYP